MRFENILPFPSYCINMKSRTDRWNSVAKEFKKIGISPIKFDAIENKENPVSGCRASHLAILEEARKKSENVFIFEDDAQFIDENIAYMSGILEDLSNVEWDMFYLGGNLLRPAYQISKHLARLSHCYSTHSYAVNKNFLERLVFIIENNQQFPIDVVYGDYIVPSFKCYISIPMLCIQGESYSDILKKNVDYSIPMNRYEHFLIKDPRFSS